ncbi:MAG TPA: membrane protein insertase YidC, partial [Casimicrobiaceae bacterium]|nr:membrane protein insertase YidC [Casimicrobiaceae bacterium]
MNKLMDTQRLILWLIFTFSAVMLWQAWEREKNPPPPATVTAPAQRAAGEPAQQPAAGAPAAGVPAQAAAGAPPVSTAAPAGQTVEVRTDLFVADIDTIGGTITRVALE